MYKNVGSDLQTRTVGTREDDLAMMRFRAAAPVLYQTFENLQAQIRSESNNMKDLLNQAITNLADISANRAPITINISALSFTMSSGTESGGSGNIQTTQFANTPSQPQEQQGQSTALPPLKYRMNRGVKSVPELWREWHFGLNGGKSVVEMERLQPGWHNQDNTFFARRRRVVTTIKKYARENGLSEEAAMHLAEGRRVLGRKTIDFLGKIKTAYLKTNKSDNKYVSFDEYMSLNSSVLAAPYYFIYTIL
ncbi:transcriptional activator of glycolytic enzymes-domain-containing protein [Phycomyces blakesleeanus]|uniref:Transcription activator GCR1-like domain-containing protein n=2 Tax=Phycomyces blakesleeanus TaxID=4837 RepID=A0A162UHZ0_PHYB8|nr:hypothetical protein PHYBLDRAFT_59880 [Phycomyces blakesleeanus NRRL 1555(-)]OAD76342.1 hypothetical protein PHYBLDRAFT_59880 [Phycomyces blakesleeanus NRRL 1555(-)]|eukprot:XP_018294382.1 hypothetical protein PHYBLDRAFT_59880 [Phycomyces blakesleeanus NRRL 1555(-)]